MVSYGIAETGLREIQLLGKSRLPKILNDKGYVRHFLETALNLQNITFQYILKTNDTNTSGYDFIRYLPLFYKEIFISFNECKKMTPLDSLSESSFYQQTIWNNKYFTHKGNTLCFPNWIKSNILYVGDLFDDNGFKNIERFRDRLQCKSNWLCEYRILYHVFKNIIRKFNCEMSKYVHIRSDMTILFHGAYGDINDKKCKFFYEILIRKKFHVPCYQRSIAQTFDLHEKRIWNSIYFHKIENVVDKNIAEFNYKLLNNLLCNNFYLSKWKRDISNKCSHCKHIIENTEHLVFSCANVKNVWNTVANILKIDLRWKHVIIGFYHENNSKVKLLNNVISFVALKIYKYKMYCRLEQIVESERHISMHIKNCLSFWYQVLLLTNSKININIIKVIADILWIDLLLLFPYLYTVWKKLLNIISYVIRLFNIIRQFVNSIIWPGLWS